MKSFPFFFSLSFFSSSFVSASAEIRASNSHSNSLRLEYTLSSYFDATSILFHRVYSSPPLIQPSILLSNTARTVTYGSGSTQCQWARVWHSIPGDINTGKETHNQRNLFHRSIEQQLSLSKVFRYTGPRHWLDEGIGGQRALWWSICRAEASQRALIQPPPYGPRQSRRGHAASWTYSVRQRYSRRVWSPAESTCLVPRR